MSDPAQHVLVYDVGGSHVSAAICAQSTYELRGISHAPLPALEQGHSSFSAASFCRLIHTLGLSALKAAGTGLPQIAGAELAIPGPFDYEKGISQMRHKLQSLYGVDLKSALAARFHWQPAQIRFLNDAAAFLLGEVGAGAAKGYQRAIGLTLGTGIGAAFAINGQIAPSDLGNKEGVPPGGELWNLPYNGATVEDFVSTRFLRQHYQDLTGVETEVAAIADVAKASTICPEDLVCAERSGVESKASGNAAGQWPPPNDPCVAHCRARQVFEEFGRHLGLVLNQHAAAFDPGIIVLGGGIARASSLFLPTTRKTLADFHPKIAISTLMDSAPLAGAGVHWFTAVQ